MSNAWRVLKQGMRWIAFAIVVAAGLGSIVASVPPRPDDGGIVLSVWRAGGNSVLTLNSDIRQGVMEAIDFSSEPYPPGATADEAFYTYARINNLMGGTAALRSFKLECGYDTTTGETSRETTIVFWSSDYWEGTKSVFRCGPSSTPPYEMAGTIGTARSFCLYTDHSPFARQTRCFQGPRCDDGRKNGDESDVDCGGSCSNKCGVHQACSIFLNDCVSGVCLDGVCQAPSCFDHVKNGNETDVDCGGSCGQCQVGQACKHNWECTSGRCWNNKTECVAGPTGTTSGTTNSTTCSGATATSAAIRYVFAEDLNRCGHVFGYWANSLGEARGCARADGYFTAQTLCEYGVQIQPSPRWVASVVATSESNAITCATATICANCAIDLQADLFGVETRVCYYSP